MIRQVPGPVLAVGHSYGGAVITNAVTTTDSVVGLVYVAAFAPDEGEFHAVFAGDLPDGPAAVTGASQRPIAAIAFGEKNGVPAWKSLPSWAVVATVDKAAGADVVLEAIRIVSS